MKLRAKLMLTFLLLSIIPVILVGYVVYNHSERTIKRERFDDLVLVNILKANELRNWVYNKETTIEKIVFVPQVSETLAPVISYDPGQPEYIEASNLIRVGLGQMAGELGVTELSILRPSDGITVFSTNEKNMGQSRKYEPYFMQGQRISYAQGISNPSTSESLGVIIGMPLNDMTGNLIGVLAISLDMSELSNIMAQASGLSQTQDTYLIDSFGNFVTAPRLGKGYILDKAIRAEGTQTILEGHDNVVVAHGSYKNYRGVSVIGAYQLIPEWGWYIQTEIDRSEALKSIHDLRNILIAIGSGVTVVVAVLALFFSRTITRPVHRLTEGAFEIGQGDLDHRVGTKAKDEIGDLSRAFDRMGQNLKEATVSRDDLVKEMADHKRTGEELERSEAKYRAFFETSLDGILISTQDNRVLAANPAACRMFKMTEAEIIQAGRTGLVDTTDPRLALHLKDQAANSQSRGEMVMVRKGGDRFLVEKSSAVFHDSEGNLFKSVIFRDITERKRAEEKLRESERRFEDVAENAREWIWEIGLDGKYTYASSPVEKILGYKPEEIIGKSSYDLLHPEDKERMKETAPEAFAQKPSFRETLHRILHKNGNTIWLVGSGIPVLDEKGNLLGYRGSSTDITERRRTEQELRRSEEKVTSIFNAAPIGIGMTVNRAIIELNTRLCEITGYSKDEMMGKSMPVLYPSPEDYESARNEVFTQIAQKGTCTYETQWKRKDGVLIDVLLNFAPLNQADPSLGVTFTAMDITERKRMEQEIREKNKQLETQADELLIQMQEAARARAYSEGLLQNMSDAFMVIDFKGIVSDVNDVYLKMMGATREEVLGKSITLAPQAEAGKGKAFERLSKCAAGIAVEKREIIVTNSCGEKITLDIGHSVIKDASGKPLNVFVVLRDITAHKKMEEKLQQYSEKLEEMVEERTWELKDAQADLVRSERLAMMGQFSGSISHELRNPLGVIDSSAYYLKTKLKDADEKITLHIDRIKSAAVKANAIIQSILELTRMQDPKPDRIDINAVISGAIATSNLPAKVELLQDYSEPEIWVNGDLEQLLMAFQNIIKNAVDAIEDAGTLKVTVHTTIEGRVEISISDSGIGIAPENLSRIFEPLFSTKAKGIGFGLAITQMVIEKHKGTIEVKSEVGKGTTFIVRLPRSIGEKQ